ncbi:MAG: LD-carboxypeptidase [Patescibacteria group bacterium]
MKIFGLKKGDVFGVIAPSRPIHNIKSEVEDGMSVIKKNGFIVKPGGNINKHFFYSAGKVAERIFDIHEMFSDKEVRAIICATGGASASQLIEKLDYDLIKNNPKFFLGYSDITSLLLAIHKKTKMPVFYGPAVYDFSNLSSSAKKFLFQMFAQEQYNFKYPSLGKTWRKGKAKGKLVGGVLSRIDGLLATGFMPDLDGKILFWEETGVCPAMIDFLLQQLKLAGVFDKISGMIVGHLSDCIDKKYPNDNRSIAEIVLERTEGFNFPILKVEYFGHDIKNFYTMPIGYEAWLDAGKKSLSVRLPS